MISRPKEKLSSEYKKQILIASGRERVSPLSLIKRLLKTVFRALGFEIRKIPNAAQQFDILGTPLEDPEAMVKEQLQIFKAVTGQDYAATAEARYPVNHVYEVNKPFSDPEGLSGDLLIATGTMVKLLHLAPGASVLDLGCGCGWTSILLARCGFRVTGIDINSASLAIGQRNAEASGVSVKFINQDMQSFTVDHLFDAVVIFDSLHHCLRERSVLARAESALRPGGRILLCEPEYPDQDSAGILNHEAAIHTMRKYGTLEKGLGTRYLTRVLFYCGFEVVTVFKSQGNYQWWLVARKPLPEKRATQIVISTSDLNEALKAYE